MLPSATNRTEKHGRFGARRAQAPILAPELKPALGDVVWPFASLEVYLEY